MPPIMLTSLPFLKREFYIRDIRYKRGVLTALRNFKKAKTFKRPANERFEEMKKLVKNLSEIYEIEPEVTVVWNVTDDLHTGRSRANIKTNTIYLSGSILSILTLLHEFAHIKGCNNEITAQRWAVNLFRRVYPKQFEKLEFNQGLFFKAS